VLIVGEAEEEVVVVGGWGKGWWGGGGGAAAAAELHENLTAPDVGNCLETMFFSDSSVTIYDCFSHISVCIS